MLNVKYLHGKNIVLSYRQYVSFFVLISCVLYLLWKSKKYCLLLLQHTKWNTSSDDYKQCSNIWSHHYYYLCSKMEGSRTGTGWHTNIYKRRQRVSSFAISNTQAATKTDTPYTVTLQLGPPMDWPMKDIMNGD